MLLQMDRINAKELDLGSWKVIMALEKVVMYIYRKGGDVRSDLIDEILTKIPTKNLVRAPKKPQQVWFY